MSATTTPAGTTVHAFVTMAGTTKCFTCGKSRNTSAHGYNAKARSAAQAGAQAATVKAEKVTAKAKAQADTAAAAEDAVTAVYEKFAAARAERTCPACGESTAAEPHSETCPMAIHPVPTAPLTVITLDGEETTVQAAPTEAERMTAAMTEAAKTADGTPADFLAKVNEALTTAEATPVTHRISWFVYLEDGVRTRYSSTMTGDLPAWDLTCSCGWDSKTGGATKGAVRKLMAQHKADASA